jgi:hypothetical protein
MFNREIPGFELLERELKELELLNSRSMPSLNAFLEKHHLFMTEVDYKELKKIMVGNKKWKIVPVHDWSIVRRGKKK